MNKEIFFNQRSQTKLWLVIIAIIIIGLAILFFTQRGGEEKEEIIKIGVIVPLSGENGPYGLAVKDSIELAKRDMALENIELIYEDSKCEKEAAVTAINKLISLDGVQAVIGELCSPATLAAAPIAQEKGVPLITPASTNTEISELGDYIFRTIPSDLFQGSFGAGLIYQNGYRKLAVLYTNEDYGIGFNNVLKKVFPELGGEVVTSQAFERGTLDLKTQLTEIKKAEAEAIYIISNSPDSSIVALKQIKELDLEVGLFGSEGLKGNDIIEGAAGAAEGLILTSVSIGKTDFIEKHKSVYNKEPDLFAAQAYDAFKAIALVIKGGAKTKSEIRDKLATVEFNGVSGKIKFDHNGDVGGNFDVCQVKEGEFELLEE